MDAGVRDAALKHAISIWPGWFGLQLLITQGHPSPLILKLIDGQLPHQASESPCMSAAADDEEF